MGCWRQANANKAAAESGCSMISDHDLQEADCQAVLLEGNFKPKTGGQRVLGFKCQESCISGSIDVDAPLPFIGDAKQRTEDLRSQIYPMVGRAEDCANVPL